MPFLCKIQMSHPLKITSPLLLIIFSQLEMPSGLAAGSDCLRVSVSWKHGQMTEEQGKAVAMCYRSLGGCGQE